MNSIDNEVNEPLHDVIFKKINGYLDSLDTKKLTNFYAMYLSEIEPPLLNAVMEKNKYNQVRAAKMLGISRGTLRKKLVEHFDDKYCGTKEDRVHE